MSAIQTCDYCDKTYNLYDCLIDGTNDSKIVCDGCKGNISCFWDKYKIKSTWERVNQGSSYRRKPAPVVEKIVEKIIKVPTPVYRTKIVYVEKPTESTSISQSDNDQNTCKICLDNSKEIVFVPCGHYAACEDCSESLIKCPICRADIVDKIKMYNA